MSNRILPSSGLKPEMEFVSPGKVKSKLKRRLPWFTGCSLFAFGFMLGVALLVGSVLFYIGTPVSTQPLPTRQPLTEIPDLSASLSESYLNNEIMREVKDKNPSILNVINLKEINLKILSGEQLQIDARLGNFLVDVEVSVTESIGVQSGKVALRATGQPKIGKGTLPVDINSVIQFINNIIVEPQINKQITTIKVNNRVLKLLDLQTSDRILTVRFQAQ